MHVEAPPSKRCYFQFNGSQRTYTDPRGLPARWAASLDAGGKLIYTQSPLEKGMPALTTGKTPAGLPDNWVMALTTDAAAATQISFVDMAKEEVRRFVGVEFGRGGGGG